VGEIAEAGRFAAMVEIFDLALPEQLLTIAPAAEMLNMLGLIRSRYRDNKEVGLPKTEAHSVQGFSPLE